MQKIDLYRYETESGIIITPEQKSEKDVVYCYRLIADDEKILTNGVEETICVDTHNPDEWTETSMSDEATAEDYEAALAELGVKEESL